MRNPSQSGVTLIELMITIAIIAIISAIAVPAYNSYLRESRMSTARLNAEPLRLALEDFYLDNDTYGMLDGSQRNQHYDPKGTQDLYTDNSASGLHWRPDGDQDQYQYSVVAGMNANGGGAEEYTITVTPIDFPAERIEVTGSK